MPQHHRSHRWIINIEHDERSLADNASDMKSIAEALLAAGKVEIEQGGETHILEPLDPSGFVLRYEQMPGGEYKLKIELEWHRSVSPSNPGGPVRIGAPK